MLGGLRRYQSVCLPSYFLFLATLSFSAQWNQSVSQRQWTRVYRVESGMKCDQWIGQLCIEWGQNAAVSFSVISRAVQPWARVRRLVLRSCELGRSNSFQISIELCNCYSQYCWFIQPRIVISSPRCGRWIHGWHGSCLHEMLCSLAKKCTRPALPEHYLSANVSKFLGNINWKVSNSTWNDNLNLIWSCDTRPCLFSDGIESLASQVNLGSGIESKQFLVLNSWCFCCCCCKSNVPRFRSRRLSTPFWLMGVAATDKG